MKNSKKLSTRFTGWLLLVCAVIGLVASITLLHETFAVAKDPSYVPSCNINPLLSCKSVMASSQSALFLGIPNPVFGVMAFAMLLAFAVLVLANTTFKPWVWLAGVAAAAGGVLFSAYLYFTSLLTLGTICPWCFVTWIVTIAAFWGVLTYSLGTKQFNVPPALKKAASFWVRYATVILVGTYAALLFGILVRFREVLFA